ncbi:MAG: hypothetical protein J0L86_14010 [Flavobacteriales bacterium]|nr:hypothetical protein [Flavobacteriales bacterium]
MKTKKLLNKVIYFLLLLICVQATIAQINIDTINSQNYKLDTSLLKDANNTYLVYFTDSTKTKKMGADNIWERSIKKEKYQNNDSFKFDWKWISNDEIIKQTSNRCDGKTLAPISHFSINKTPNNSEIKAYKFENGFMIKDKNEINNSVSDDFKLKMNIPVLNWELDIETYSLLPIKKVGQIFEISFFDVNQSQPKYQRYEVIGEDSLEISGSKKLACWLLKINYDEKNSAIYWLTKEKNEMMKCEEKVAMKKGYIYCFKIKQ